MTVVSDCRDSLRWRHSQGCHHMIDNQDERSKHAGSLEGIRPHQRLDATLAGIEPDEHHHHRYRHPERNSHSIEHEPLQQNADHEKADCRSRHLRQQKERSTRLVGTFAQSLLQIAVDGGEIIPVVDRQQEKTYQEVAQDKADAHLQIGHICLHHHTRHTHEGDARDRGAHHSESHHIPRRTPVRPIESFIAAGTPCRNMAEEQQHAEICQNRDDDNHFFSYIFIYVAKVQ